ncbi:MAG: hypothetical protein NTX24_02905 [Candidatus Pacearchaeota archaeon]|nr:hypothetical protein [Candidatus Pacearchaeota archaeon]
MAEYTKKPLDKHILVCAPDSENVACVAYHAQLVLQPPRNSDEKKSYTHHLVIESTDLAFYNHRLNPIFGVYSPVLRFLDWDPHSLNTGERLDTEKAGEMFLGGIEQKIMAAMNSVKERLLKLRISGRGCFTGADLEKYIYFLMKVVKIEAGAITSEAGIGPMTYENGLFLSPLKPAS